MLEKLFFFLLIFFSYGVNAQEIVADFGDVSIEEMMLKECSFDKSASAMILLDVQETRVTENKITSERRIRIKIFNIEGYKYASIIIPYISRKRASRITDISGFAYNLDAAGKIVSSEIDKDDIYKQKSNENVTSIRFAFPNVKPGTVIEYKFEKIEKDIFRFDPWFFQSSIPTQLSILKIVLPPKYDLRHRIISGIPVIIDQQDKTKNRQPAGQVSYMLRNVPGFRAEPFMSSVKDNLYRIDFSIVPPYGPFMMAGGEAGWHTINFLLNRSPLNKISKEHINGTLPIIDSVNAFTSDTAKINAIFNIVKDRIYWDGQRTFYTDEIQEAWDNKMGNSAEINIIILNLLRRVGIKAFPMMVSTKNNGKVDIDFATLGQFNTVNVLAFDSIGNYYVLDGILKHQSYKVPPINIVNSMGFIVDSLKGLWVNLKDQRPLLRTATTAFANLQNNGELNGEASVAYFDLARAEKLNEKKDEVENNFVQKDFAGFKMDSVIVENSSDNSAPLINRYKFNLSANKTDKFIFLDPFLLSSLQKNPFKDSVRNSSIDFGANTKMTYHLTVNIPEGLKVVELPRNTGIRMADTSISFSRLFEVRGNLLMIQSTLEFKRSQFDKEEYPALKQVFDKIYALSAEQVVLKND